MPTLTMIITLWLLVESETEGPEGYCKETLASRKDVPFW